ncbi:MAG TPA: hypothetical protein HPP51_03060 [Planctomycetes bacterium]|nr:hypothetical protein [Planctomycetota bacterium]
MAAENSTTTADLDYAIKKTVAATNDPQRTEARKPWRPPPIRRLFRKIGRNQPCPCGSGLKFKRCHCTKMVKKHRKQ